MLYRTDNPHGGDVYGQPILLDYSANTNPFGTPPGVLEAMHRVLPQVHRYPDPYCRELVQAIASFEHVPESWILCGNGAAELIYAYCDALRPRCALLPAPTFSEYGLGLARVGGRVELYPLRQENEFDLDDGILAHLASHPPEVLFLCNPNNPTGRLLTPERLRQILEVCRRQQVRLFLDECFLDLSEGGVSMKALLAAYPELLILKAFTKSYGLAGVRLGYCLCGDVRLLTTMSRAVQPWNVSTLAQAAGVAALQETEFLRKTRELLTVERRWMQRKLEDLGFWVCPSSANYLLFSGPPGLDVLLLRQGIAIRNCENYPGLASGWYRVAVRRREENEQLLSALERLGREGLWQKI